MNQNNTFIPTKEYKKFVEFCRACHREKYIGLCYGPPGVGKSISAENFANWHRISKEIDTHLKHDNYSNIEIDMNQFNTIVYVPIVHDTPKRVTDALESLVFSFNYLKNIAITNVQNRTSVYDKNYVEMIIVDEADRLQPNALEAIRDKYDRGFSDYRENKGPAVVLIGMPGLEKRLVRFPQLYSRIGFVHAFQTMKEEEVKFVIQKQLKESDIELNHEDFTDNEAIAAITRITQGNFRLIDRLLKQSIRIMKVNQLSTISKEIVEAARECLVIGTM